MCASTVVVSLLQLLVELVQKVRIKIMNSLMNSHNMYASIVAEKVHHHFPVHVPKVPTKPMNSWDKNVIA